MTSIYDTQPQIVHDAVIMVKAIEELSFTTYVLTL